MKKILLSSIISLTIFSSESFAGHNHHRSDAHAPIGVMRDHTHEKGQFMISYRYSQMSMEGLRGGSNEIDRTEALQQFMAVPSKMKMKMHMYGVMYGLTDRFTVGVNGSYVTKDMDVQRRNNTQFKMETADIGDTKVNGLYKILGDDNSHLQFNMGVSIPTGENSEYQGNGMVRMGYPMQSGSGSYELLPGFSYTNLQDSYSFGGQINSIFRLDTNDNGYKYGDEYSATGWIAKPLTHDFSLSSRLDYRFFEAIEGQDQDLAAIRNSSPIFRSDLGEGEKLFGYLGANYLFNSGLFKGNRFAFEFGIPLYQRIDGPFLQDKYKFTIGWQQSF